MRHPPIQHYSRRRFTKRRIPVGRLTVNGSPDSLYELLLMPAVERVLQGGQSIAPSAFPLVHRATHTAGNPVLSQTSAN